MFLEDEYRKGGNDVQEFDRALAQIDNATSIVRKDRSKCELLGIYDINGTKMMVPLKIGKPAKDNKRSVTFKLLPYDRDAYIAAGYSETVMDETEAAGFMLGSSRHPEKAVPVSPLAITSVAGRTKIGGKSFTENSLGRNIFIAEKLAGTGKISVVERCDECTGLKKVFALMSEDYAPILQSLISDIVHELMNEEISGLGIPVCRNWEVSHEITRVYLEFPDAKEGIMKAYEIKDEMIPGVLIETSDTGDCAFRVKGYYRIGSYIAYMPEEFSRIHVGDVKEDEIVSAAKKKIFPAYTVWPRRMLTYMTLPITKPGTDKGESQKIIKNLCESIIRETGIGKVLGKNRVKLLKESLAEDFYGLNGVTAYDVVKTFLTLPKRINETNPKALRRISMVVGEVMDYDFLREEKILRA